MSKIRLRELSRQDLPRVNKWRNDPDVIAYLGSNFLYINEQIDEKWFDGYLASRDKNVRLAIIDGATEQHIGNVNLTAIHPINRSAEFSIFIGEKQCQSKGLGGEVTRLVLAHGFGDLNLNRIYLFVLKTNERARKMYQRLGFVEEGCEREAVFKNGEYCDLIVMSVLRADYKAGAEELTKGKENTGV